MKKKVLGIIVCMLLIATTVLPVAGTLNVKNVGSADSRGDTDWWTMFRHDLQHSGYSTSLAPNTNNTLWSYTTGDWVDSSPAVADGKVYIGSDDSKAYCLDADTGGLIWSYTTGDNVFSSPAVADGKVYIGSLDFKVYCFMDENQPPNKPYIDGPTSGKAGTSYTYNFSATDPNVDEVEYYIEWGDGGITDWTSFLPSGVPYYENHTWTTEGTFTIRAKAKDIYDAESEWATLTVSMPRNKALTNSLLLRLFERFPNAFPLLRYILGFQ